MIETDFLHEVASRLQPEYRYTLQERIQSKLYDVLQANWNDIFFSVTSDTLMGIIRSSSDSTRYYATFLRANGNTSCVSAKMRQCGGQKGNYRICKHLL